MANSKRPLAAALGAAFLATSIAPLVAAESNPFSAQPLTGGYNLASFDKQQEGGCGANKAEGEGSCGGAKADGEGACGDKKTEGDAAAPAGDTKAAAEGSCGDNKAAGEGKCGEGKCGAK